MGTPELGTLPPDRFIDIAEDNGLIVPLTAYVIEQACRQARGWCGDGTERQPFVSVNVSASNVRDPGFLPLVKSVLADTDLPSHALQLEFTENTNLRTPATSVIRLQELAALGVGMAIDDFGTGFSSLAYLRTLPVAVVKLDGLFIKNLGGNLHDRLADEQIARAIIDLAHTLGLTVIAEQVETAGQAARLRVLGATPRKAGTLRNHCRGTESAQHSPAKPDLTSDPPTYTSLPSTGWPHNLEELIAANAWINSRYSGK